MSRTSVAAWCRGVCLFVAIALIGLTADLLTKDWAFDKLGMPGEFRALIEPELNATYWVWEDVFGFQTTLNPGALFGIGAGQITFLVTFSLIFLVGIIIYVLGCAWRSLLLSAIFGMMVAGICGNLYDRLGWHELVFPVGHPAAGEQIYAVRDWILCVIWTPLGPFHWPNFNIADCLLVCSVIILLVDAFLFNRPSVGRVGPEPAA